GMFNSCQKIEAVPDVAQPVVRLEVDKGSTTIGNQTVTIGPEKDYEQDSKVYYKLTVSSSKPLTKLIVSSTSLNASPLSKVVSSEPANVIDANGNFTQNVKEAVILYAYHIDPSVTPLSTVTVSFTFQNEQNYVGLSSHTFSVIKKGSTNGKLLSKIEMQFSVYNREGIGTQDNLDLASGVKLVAGEVMKNRGPFYSIESRNDIAITSDAIALADKIDIVGYKTKAAGTNPVLTNGQFYLVSPSDTIILTSRFTGAPAIPDTQSLKMRNAIRAMAAVLKSSGKTLRKVLFKRLDNITGPGQVTAAAFDILTHDNEFDVLLAGVAASGTTYAGPVGFDEVYGFVMDDGRRGMIRTISPTIQVTTTVGGLVPGTIYTIPNPNTGNLLCTIKFR
ncbi:MAG TPA: hypothetical protein VMY77_18545, partial [Chitinophagaceae bacterium]|nr:hypothetical protein [Chitinophagaceae bacterium]